MNVRDAQKLRDALLIIGILIMLVGYMWEPLLIIGAVIAFSCLIPHFLYNRCPNCKKQLGRNGGKFCQHCGSKLDR